MARLLFHGREGLDDGRIRADVKINWFDGKLREGRGRGFTLIKGKASHKNVVSSVFRGDRQG